MFVEGSFKPSRVKSRGQFQMKQSQSKKQGVVSSGSKVRRGQPKIK